MKWIHLVFSIHWRVIVAPLKVNTDSLIFDCNIISLDVHLCLSQLAYDAWVTSSKTALKDLKKEKKKMKKEEKKRAKRELQRQQGEMWHLCNSV